MNEVIFIFKKDAKDETYICKYFPSLTSMLLESYSKRSYEKAGKDAINWLIKNEISNINNKTVLLITQNQPNNYEPATKKELTRIRNSLEKHIQENKLNIELKVA